MSPSTRTGASTSREVWGIGAVAVVAAVAVLGGLSTLVTAVLLAFVTHPAP